MTAEAWSALLAEIDRLEADVVLDRVAEDDGLIRLASADPARRRHALLAIRDEAEVDDAPGCAVIGRRVTVRDEDDTTETYAIVLPGDGDPANGWLSADSPLGTAVIGRRAGDTVVVRAPAGPREVRIVAVE
jgi:transcription elongation GreA/GreB family factor